MSALLHIVARDLPRDDRPAPETIDLDVKFGEVVEIGREGRLRVGAGDQGVSRVAITVVATTDAWQITLSNRNGAMAHAWARSTELIPYAAQRSLRWPRIGIRLFGNDQAVEHWVLLEADAYPTTSIDSDQVGPLQTQIVRRPRLLTVNQRAAVYATFPEHLAWPPVVAPAARSLEAVAARLGITPSAVRERLRPVQDRARELGLHGPIGVTDPEYVHHLAAHGYFPDVPPPYAT